MRISDWSSDVCSSDLLHSGGGADGQGHGEGRALAEGAVDTDAALVRLDDAVADGEADPGALADVLGGEEGPDDTALDLFGDARAAVGECQGHLLRGGGVGGADGDRKSVVLGKSVSVRVGHGGGRIK